MPTSGRSSIELEHPVQRALEDLVSGLRTSAYGAVVLASSEVVGDAEARVPAQRVRAGPPGTRARSCPAVPSVLALSTTWTVMRPPVAGAREALQAGAQELERPGRGDDHDIHRAERQVLLGGRPHREQASASCRRPHACANSHPGDDAGPADEQSQQDPDRQTAFAQRARRLTSPSLDDRSPRRLSATVMTGD